MPYKDIKKQRESYRKLYAKSPERRKTIKKSHSDRVARALRILEGYKIFLGCIDCGYREHSAALDFDHREPEKKSRGIAEMVRSSASLLRVFEEIFKCDVRCANCHRVRHAKEIRVCHPNGQGPGLRNQ